MLALLGENNIPASLRLEILDHIVVHAKAVVCVGILTLCLFCPCKVCRHRPVLISQICI